MKAQSILCVDIPTSRVSLERQRAIELSTEKLLSTPTQRPEVLAIRDRNSKAINEN